MEVSDKWQDYLLAKDKLTQVGVDNVENKRNVSRKSLLESIDGSAALRPVWDELASKYDAVITPSAVDEAPRGLSRTGDPVSVLFLLGDVRVLMNTSHFAACGLFCMRRRSTSLALREKMAFLLGLPLSVHGTMICMSWMWVRELGESWTPRGGFHRKSIRCSDPKSV